MSPADSTRCSTCSLPTRMCGSRGVAGAEPRSARATVCTSSVISSGSTPPSMTIRSMPACCRRRISSPIVSAARGTGTSPTTSSSPTMPIVRVGLAASATLTRLGQRADVALHDRMIGRVELRAAQRRRETAGDLLGDLGALGGAHVRSRSRRAAAAALARAILRTRRLPVRAASSSTATVSGEPMRISAVAAASRSAAVLDGCPPVTAVERERAAPASIPDARFKAPSASMICRCAAASVPRGVVLVRT